MGNIVQFRNKADNLSLVVRAHATTLFGHKRKFALIVVREKATGLEWIHPLSDFILHFWDNSSYSTQKENAYALISFLQYVSTEKSNDCPKSINKSIKTLYELSEWHVSNFLNHLGKTNSSDSVNFHRHALTKFYYFLSSRSFLPLIDPDKFVILENSTTKKLSYRYDFPNILMPSKAREQRVIHWFDASLIIPFIEMAYEVSNPIAFGVWMQIFGGLRIGDVVNLRHQDISTIGGSYGEQGLRLEINERHLREDIYDSSGSTGVKKPGSRVVFNYSTWVPTLYRNHIRLYKPANDSDALFVNRNGMAMTGDVYRYHFTKLKHAFINKLREHGGTECMMMALHLETHTWSSHIGRGLFSNMLAKTTNNPALLARYRGDDDLTSAITYLGDSEITYKEIEKAISDFHKGIFSCLARRMVNP